MTAVTDVRGRRWLWCVVGLALAGSGCATLSGGTSADYARSMAAAESAMRGDDALAAIQAYRRAAEAAPALTLPWLEIAEIEAGLADWPQAVAAAREVLQRDPDNVVARDLHLRGSLQLAEDSLPYLPARPSDGDGNDGDDVREMATGLLEGLIQTLGDEAIPAVTRKRLEARSEVHPHRTRPRAAPARPLKKAPEKTPADPFDVLGGG